MENCVSCMILSWYSYCVSCVMYLLVIWYDSVYHTWYKDDYICDVSSGYLVWSSIQRWLYLELIYLWWIWCIVSVWLMISPNRGRQAGRNAFAMSMMGGDWLGGRPMLCPFFLQLFGQFPHASETSFNWTIDDLHYNKHSILLVSYSVITTFNTSFSMILRNILFHFWEMFSEITFFIFIFYSLICLVMSLIKTCLVIN